MFHLPLPSPRLLQALVAGLFACSPQADIVVTNCTESAFRDAVRQGGTITFGCEGVITLTNAVQISTQTLIQSSNRAVTLNGGASSRLFIVDAGAVFTLRNMNLLNARVTGADGTNGVSGEPAAGAAIFNSGIVNLIQTTLSGNEVIGGLGGDAPDVGDSGRGIDGGFGGDALGAAIYNNGGILFVTNCVFFLNRATAGGGGFGGAGGPLGNGGNGGDGGPGGSAQGAAIFNALQGQIAIWDSTFSSNRVEAASGGQGGPGGGVLGFAGDNAPAGLAAGAAIFNQSGTVLINGATFLRQGATNATGSSGLPAFGLQQAEAGSKGGNALGGALYNSGGFMAVTNATFTANTLTAGAGGAGGIGSSAGFGTDGGRGGAGGDAGGAALYNAAGGAALVVNCTFHDNSVTAGLGGIGGAAGTSVTRDGRDGVAGSSLGTALGNAQGTLTVINTLLSSPARQPACGGSILDGGGNLSTDSSCGFTSSSSRSGIDPRLGILSTNGGFTQTIPLLADSPAIDAAIEASAPPADQRHASRFGRSDIGAFEFNGGVADLKLTVLKAAQSTIQINWPNTGLTLQLESTDAFTTPRVWTPVTDATSSSTSLHAVNLSATNQTRFFRLRQP
jgi:hypothetical protein